MWNVCVHTQTLYILYKNITAKVMYLCNIRNLHKTIVRYKTCHREFYSEGTNGNV